MRRITPASDRRFEKISAANVLAVLLLTACAGTSAAEPGARAEFSAIAAYVERHFDAMPDREPGDIISRGQVERLFSHLQRAGWHVPRQNAILHDVPGDDDFVVRRLRTKAGAEFMRRISSYPLGYDRLYRLAELPGGRRTVSELITGKDGHKLIEYMSTSRGGKQLGKLLNNTPKGEDFNKPLGRIFTVEQLIQRLKKSYEQQAG